MMEKREKESHLINKCTNRNIGANMTKQKQIGHTKGKIVYQN